MAGSIVDALLRMVESSAQTKLVGIVCWEVIPLEWLDTHAVWRSYSEIMSARL